MFVLIDLVLAALFKKTLVLQKIIILQYLGCSFKIACLDKTLFKIRSKLSNSLKRTARI